MAKRMYCSCGSYIREAFYNTVECPSCGRVYDLSDRERSKSGKTKSVCEIFAEIGMV